MGNRQCYLKNVPYFLTCSPAVTPEKMAPDETTKQWLTQGRRDSRSGNAMVRMETIKPNIQVKTFIHLESLPRLNQSPR